MRPTLSSIQASSQLNKKSSIKDAEENNSDNQLSLIIQFYKLDLDEYEKHQKRIQYAWNLLSTAVNAALRGCINDEADPHLAM